MLSMDYLFDTKALVALFDGERGAERVKEMIEDVEGGKALGCISAVTLSEVYYIYARKRKLSVAKERIEQIAASNLKIIPVDEKVAVKAGEYRLMVMPLADALIAACAYFASAKVVTNDKHFDKPGIEAIDFSRRA